MQMELWDVHKWCHTRVFFNALFLLVSCGFMYSELMLGRISTFMKVEFNLWKRRLNRGCFIVIISKFWLVFGTRNGVNKLVKNCTKIKSFGNSYIICKKNLLPKFLLFLFLEGNSLLFLYYLVKKVLSSLKLLIFVKSNILFRIKNPIISGNIL